MSNLLKTESTTRAIRKSDFLLRTVSALLVVSMLLPMGSGLFAGGIDGISKGVKLAKTVSLGKGGLNFTAGNVSYNAASASIYINGDMSTVAFSSSTNSWGSVYFSKVQGSISSYNVETDIMSGKAAGQPFLNSVSAVADRARSAYINNVTLDAPTLKEMVFDPFGKGTQYAAEYFRGTISTPYPSLSFPAAPGTVPAPSSALASSLNAVNDTTSAVRDSLGQLRSIAHDEYLNLHAELEELRAQVVSSVSSPAGTPVKPIDVTNTVNAAVDQVNHAQVLAAQNQAVAAIHDLRDADVAALNDYRGADMNYAKARFDEMGIKQDSFEANAAGQPGKIDSNGQLDPTGNSGSTAGSGTANSGSGSSATVCNGNSCVNVGALLVGVAVGFLMNWIGSKLFAGMNPRWASVAQQSFSLATGIGTSMLLSSVGASADFGALGAAMTVLGYVFFVVAIVMLVVSIVMAIIGDDVSTSTRLWRALRTHMIDAMSSKEDFTRVLAFASTRKAELEKLKKNKTLPLSAADATKYDAQRKDLNHRAEKLHDEIQHYEDLGMMAKMGGHMVYANVDIKKDRSELDSIIPKVLDLDTLLVGEDLKYKYREFEKQKLDYCGRMDLYQGYITYEVPTRNAIRTKKDSSASSTARNLAATDLEKLTPQAVQGILYNIKHQGEKMDALKADLADTEQRLKEKREPAKDKNPVFLNYSINASREILFMAQPFARLIANRIAANYKAYGITKQQFDMLLDYSTSNIAINPLYRICTVDVK